MRYLKRKPSGGHTRSLIITLVLVLMSLLGYGIAAGPTIIRDNRISDIGITPVLGRGYTMATNTFQSTCLQNITRTEPSYDFTYRYAQMETSGSVSRSKSTNKPRVTDKIYNRRYRQYLQKITTKKGTTTTKNENGKYNQRVVVTIDLDSYYSSVDEANSTISNSAGALLDATDYPGFFSACGSYYIRSINRRAKFVSIFKYETETNQRDKKFEGEIESRLKSFRKVTRTRTTGAWFWKKTTRTTKWEQQGGDQVTVSKLDQEFNAKSSKLNLTITSAAFGLGKNDKATLVAYDFDTFKNSIKDAFLSMQNPQTGKVTSVEVVPWVENTEFQSRAKLESDTTPQREPVVDQNGAPVLDKDGNPTYQEGAQLLLFEKKFILTSNAEFLAEVERVNRGLLNNYYKARLCRKQIKANWTDKDGNLKAEYANQKLLNNRTGETTYTVKDFLDKVLTQDSINKMKADQTKFMYGAEKRTAQNPTAGASACMRRMFRGRMFRVLYEDIKPCQDLVGQMGVTQFEIINDHCMPRLMGEDNNAK